MKHVKTVIDFIHRKKLIRLFAKLEPVNAVNDKTQKIYG